MSDKYFDNPKVGDLVLVDLMLDNASPDEYHIAKAFDGEQVVGYVQHFMYDEDDADTLWASIHVLEKGLPFELDMYHRYISTDPETIDRPMSEFNATWFPKN